MDGATLTMVLTGLGGVATATSAAAVAVWRQIIKRVDRLQDDAGRWEAALTECIDARARAEAELASLNIAHARLLGRVRRLERTIRQLGGAV